MPSDHELLRRFVSSRCDNSFRTLVERHINLVHATAFRTTRNHSLTHDVSQQVFTKLACHPDSAPKTLPLTAWLHRTTHSLSVNVVRSEERRRQREVTAVTLAEMKNSTHQWEKLSPVIDDALDSLKDSDRVAILLRFYEGHSHASVGKKLGLSEDTARFRVRRALDKIQRTLTKRGITTTASALATILPAQACPAAPAAVLSSVSLNSLAASHSITTSTTFISTIQAMSTVKQISMTIAAVVSATLIPFSWQRSIANDLRAERNRIDLELASPAETKNSRSSLTRTPFTSSSKRTVGHLIHLSNTPTDLEGFIENLTALLLNMDDGLAMSRVLLPLSKMSSEEIAQMMANLNEYPISPRVKSGAFRILAPFAEDSPAAVLEATIAAGESYFGYGSTIKEWAQKDPDAALKWYLKKKEAGLLDPKGIDNDRPLDSVLFGNLVSGVAGALVKTEEGQQKLSSLVEGTSDETQIAALHSAVTAMIAEHSYQGDEAVAYIDQFETTEVTRSKILAQLAATGAFQKKLSTPERIDWLLSRLQTKNNRHAIKTFLERVRRNADDGLDEWAASQPAGSIRDTVYSERSHYAAHVHQEPHALKQALLINSETMRDEAIKQVISLWKKHDLEDWKNTHNRTAHQTLLDAGIDPTKFIPQN